MNLSFNFALSDNSLNDKFISIKFHLENKI
jgi:hypothetical protein